MSLTIHLKDSYFDPIITIEDKETNEIIFFHKYFDKGYEGKPASMVGQGIILAILNTKTKILLVDEYAQFESDNFLTDIKYHYVSDYELVWTDLSKYHIVGKI